MLLPMVIAFPLAGSIILLLSAGEMPRRATQLIGPGSVGLSALCALFLASSFLSDPPVSGSLHVVLWHWLTLPGFAAQIALSLDQLSLVMMLVVSCIGFLILVYAAAYMDDDADICRFFAYMTLFVASMLLLVLASDLLALYVGWEGVGLCSYLLVGFWYGELNNALAARKAFVVTRIGDALLFVGLTLIATDVGTLDIPTVLHTIHAGPQTTLGCLLLLGGAMAKSAQVPFQTWLPDAMAGPTPVSALIHAATMVTAGVYMIARLHDLFLASPFTMVACAIVGTVTLLLAAGSALTQTDIKRVLAYSTMSQLGYMYLALGCGSWQGAIFHLVTHAFFKALLFMGAGAVILRMHHEQDMFRMGGLKADMPGVFYAFLAGSVALAGLPLISAGYFSKELILSNAWNLSPLLWFGALSGAFMTALYTFRCVFLTFFGTARGHAHGHTGLAMAIPMSILAVLAIFGGYMQTPAEIGGINMFANLLSPVFGPMREVGGTGLLLIGSLVPIIGVALAWTIWKPRDAVPAPANHPVQQVMRANWGFDAIYNWLLVHPYFTLGALNRRDGLDRISDGITWVMHGGSQVLARMQSGQVRRYAGWIAAGTVIALCLAI
jgi:NADH-quinone oxidoreductase subunit L